MNTEKQYPYVSGETGKLTKCSPKLDGVATGEAFFGLNSCVNRWLTHLRSGVTGYVNVSNGNETLLAMAMTVLPLHVHVSEHYITRLPPSSLPL